LKASHSEKAGAASVVNLLCNNNFCGFVRSHEEETDNRPFLELIVHPFKESCSGWLDKNELIFGIKLSTEKDDDDDDKKESHQIIEIKNASIEFATLNPSSSESLIYTPSFQNIMGKFGEDNSKPISNVTELPAFDPTDTDTTESTRFPPTYSPRKFIPITPSMISIILSFEPDEISGMINEIRIAAWNIVEKLFNHESDEEAKTALS
jgi:hypothetical protein